MNPSQPQPGLDNPITFVITFCIFLGLVCIIIFSQKVK